MRPRLVIGDDHAVLAAGLSKLLDKDYDVLAIACNGRDVLDAVQLHRPDVVLLDISMPSLNGIEVTRQICKFFPNTNVVVLTQHTQREYIRSALQAGAKAYVLKQSAPSELMKALSVVQTGRFYITQSLLPNGIDGLAEETSSSGDLFGTALTPRQREVLQLVAEGKSGKEIASALNISLKTVEFHKAKLTRQLSLHSTAELTRYALEHGMI